MRLAAAALAALALAPSVARAQPGGGPPVEYLQPFGPPTRPFSPAVRIGPLVFLAGQMGTDPSASGALVPGGITPETRQVLDNIKRVLGAIGLSMDDVVKCTVFLADMKEWDAMNEVYRTYFKPDRLPARSALGASGLALNGRVEIECIAAARDGAGRQGRRGRSGSPPAP